jgi:hypothetical protein
MVASPGLVRARNLVPGCVVLGLGLGLLGRLGRLAPVVGLVAACAASVALGGLRRRAADQAQKQGCQQRAAERELETTTRQSSFGRGHDGIGLMARDVSHEAVPPVWHDFLCELFGHGGGPARWSARLPCDLFQTSSVRALTASGC